MNIKITKEMRKINWIKRAMECREAGLYDAAYTCRRINAKIKKKN